MAYISLYRKYRPQTFEDVVGQEHVTRTLRNAITEGRVASGYLFCGTRGTAKTTCARILAKALNCIGLDGKRTEPNPEPCGACVPCQSIAGSAFVDVLEMDAASHGKVDDVRDIVASIKFPPMEGRYKVYIIDEAHQLSRDAMDAFLKTLEEPPDRVVFILATTEQDKLPITISSRCQVFEFKRGSVTQIGTRLTEVLKSEDVTMQPAAVTLIARAADGSYRDSLSLLEQVLAYKRQDVSTRDVGLVLGAVDEDVLSRVVDIIAEANAAAAFALAGELLESGRDVRQFLKSLSGRLRDLLFLGVGAQASAMGEMDDSVELRQRAAKFAPSALLHALEVLTEAESETRRNNQHRLLLEMTLLRLMRLPQVSLPGVYTSPDPKHMSVTPVEDKAASIASSKSLSVPKIDTPPAETPPALAVPPPKAEAVPTPEAVLVTENDEPDTFDGDDAELADEHDLEVQIAPLPGDADLDVLFTVEEAALSVLVTSADEHEEMDDLLLVQQVAAEPPIEKPPAVSAPPPDASPELIQLQKLWQEVINRMSSRAPQGVDLVKKAKPVGVSGHTVTLEVASSFDIDRLQNERRRTVVEDVINKTMDVPPGTYKVKCVMQGAGGNTPKPRPVKLPADAPGDVSPLMDEVIAVFGGQVLDEGDRRG